MTGPRSYSFTHDGGSQTFAFACNRDWSISASDSWVRVSPSSGQAADGDIIVSLAVSPNMTYDSRTATLILMAEGLSETISVTQDMGLGLIVSPTSFDLTNEAQTIEIEVQKNVSYSIMIDETCKEWIKQGGTRALSADKISFSISANNTYDNREGRITVKQTDGNLSETIVVRQRQEDFLGISPQKDSISYQGGSTELRVSTNIDYVLSTNQADDWLTIGETVVVGKKDGLTTYVHTISAPENETIVARYATVVIKDADGDVLESFILAQGPQPVIEFADMYVRKVCVNKFDTNGDGEVSLMEAQSVEYFESDFFGIYQEFVTSFDELQYFSGITNLAATFRECKRLKSVTLPPKLVSLSSTFYNCLELECVTGLDEPLSYIGASTFAYCKKLRSITIPKTVKEIGEYAFYFCESLTDIVVPEGITRINGDTFAVCRSLAHITLPNSLEIIGEYAFRYCPFTELTIPGNVFEIQMAAFEYCPNLTTISIPPSVVSLKSIIFAHSGLKRITIPGTVKYFDIAVLRDANDLEYIDGPYASSDHRCLVVDGVLNSMAVKGLKEYTTPMGIVKIGLAALCSEQTPISKIIISEGVTEIEDRAFYYCPISVAYLPSTLRKIGFDGFGAGPYLQMYCKAINPPEVSDLFKNQSSRVYVPESSVNSYKSDPGWSRYSSRIQGYSF